MANSKEEKQSKALDLYEALNRNLKAVAEEKGMPSRQTLHVWKKRGYPEIRTGGKDWDEYLDGVDQARLTASKSREIEKTGDFMKDARIAIESTLDKLREKIESGAFEAKPGDLPNLIKTWALIENRDAERVAWMEAFTVELLNVCAEVVDPNQFEVIRVKFLDRNVREKKKMEMIAPNHITELPSYLEAKHANEKIDDVHDTEYVLVEEGIETKDVPEMSEEPIEANPGF